MHRNRCAISSSQRLSYYKANTKVIANFSVLNWVINIVTRGISGVLIVINIHLPLCPVLLLLLS
jgi:hypothetical protein